MLNLLILQDSKAVAAAAVDKGSELVSVEVHSPHEETVVPAVGDVVTVKVLSVNQRFVNLAKFPTVKEAHEGMAKCTQCFLLLFTII